MMLEQTQRRSDGNPFVVFAGAANPMTRIRKRREERELEYLYLVMPGILKSC